MRGYYTTYNDKVYQLVGTDMTPTFLANTPKTSSIQPTQMLDRKGAIIKIEISNMDSSEPSNKELFSELSMKLKTDKTEKIDKLSHIYRIYVEYALVDNVTQHIVDESVAIKELEGKAFLFPLGLDDENEFVSKIGVSLTAKMEKYYQSKTPYGLMCSNFEHTFTLQIKRIYVIQLTMDAFSIMPTQKMSPLPYVREDPYVRKYPPRLNPRDVHPSLLGECHPSMPNVMPKWTTSFILKESDYVTIYDSALKGDVFNSIAIEFRPNEIAFDLRFYCTDIIVAVEEDIEAILEENKKEKDNISGGEDQTDPTPNPENPDESTGSTDTDGKDTIEETPSETPSGGSSSTDEKESTEEKPSETDPSGTPSEGTTEEPGAGTEDGE